MSKKSKIKKILSILKGTDKRPPMLFIIIEDEPMPKDIQPQDEVIRITRAEKNL